MARLHGQSGQFKEDVTGGTPAVVVGITNWNIDVKGSADDATGMDSSGKKAFIAGLTEWSGSLSGMWDTTETDIIDAPILNAGATLDVEFWETADAGDTHYNGTVIVTSFKPEVAVDGVVKLSVDFQGSGALTYPTA